MNSRKGPEQKSQQVALPFRLTFGILAGMYHGQLDDQIVIEMELWKSIQTAKVKRPADVNES